MGLCHGGEKNKKEAVAKKTNKPLLIEIRQFMAKLTLIWKINLEYIEEFVCACFWGSMLLDDIIL